MLPPHPLQLQNKITQRKKLAHHLSKLRQLSYHLLVTDVYLKKMSSPMFVSFHVTCKVCSLQGVVGCHGSHSTLDFAVAHVITSPQRWPWWCLGSIFKAFPRSRIHYRWKLLEGIMIHTVIHTIVMKNWEHVNQFLWICADPAWCPCAFHLHVIGIAGGCIKTSPRGKAVMQWVCP